MKTLIKNGRIVTAVDDYTADILIEDERVSVIGANAASAHMLDRFALHDKEHAAFATGPTH